MCPGRTQIQPVPRANANGSELVRPGDGVRGSSAIHDTDAEGDVEALPMPKRRHSGAIEAELRGIGRERRSRRLRNNKRRDTKTEAPRAEPPPAKSIPSNGNDGTRSLETTAWPPRTICQHSESLALRAFPSPVRTHFFGSTPFHDFEIIAQSLHLFSKEFIIDYTKKLGFFAVNYGFWMISDHGCCQVSVFRIWVCEIS